ncbi:hypothetical protein GTA08_BOTSDO10517 [Neofusicoccum parvum]|uniref:Uncharacterized protein n=2 Tax=Neofusicoccum parvum TaxID=310453 RepID=R1ESC4_BOTPV|nr:hypothetical protein UCRNP2_2517 [Neofusicoccum parvum UCRNP2]GME41891.1 hypothetical protein GTA08_BOTSDO10517 [Neofusicoccum parvum]GME44976.1 hypothetical protein GTA08_BOTSDO10517 [Neofusicoccum parvum]
MSPPKDKFQVSNVPVVLKWDDCDGDVKYLGHRSAVTLDIRLDVPRHTASFKLRTIASLKSLAQRVPLYLFIQPDRVASLAEDDGPIQQPVKDGLIQTRKCAAITEILRLRFSLEHEANSRWKEVAEQLRDQPSLEDLRIEIMEDVEERLAQTRGEITEDLELKVDERFLTTKEELRETVEEELELVEERIKEDLSSGRAEFYVEFPR